MRKYLKTYASYLHAYVQIMSFLDYVQLRRTGTAYSAYNAVRITQGKQYKWVLFQSDGLKETDMVTHGSLII
jgi:hypothetical protein